MNDLWGDKKPAAPTPQSGAMGGWPSKANPGTSSGAPAAGASKPAAQKQSAGGTTKDDYWANKEARDLEKERIYREEDIPAMRRSVAYQVAGSLLAAAFQSEAVSFGNAAKGKRLDLMLGMLDLVANHVTARLSGEDPASAVTDDSAEPAQEDADLG